MFGIGDTMRSNAHYWRLFLVVMVALAFLSPLYSFIGSAADSKLPAGYEGVSYHDMTPIDKVTFIEHDREGIKDDFADLLKRIPDRCDVFVVVLKKSLHV